jgi:hypothetical protein
MNRIRFDFAKRNDPNSPWSKLVNPVLVARKLYLYNQNHIFTLYATTCRSPGAALSPAGRCIVEAIVRDNLYVNPGVCNEKVDKKLTSFGNLELRRYSQWENIYLVNHAHKHMNLVSKYRFDAYCMNFDRPHASMLTRSENGGVSKSYINTVVRKDISIPGTVELVTYESLRARATEEKNQNDGVVIFDEVERAIIDKDSKESDRERMMKMIMTTNRMEAKVDPVMIRHIFLTVLCFRCCTLTRMANGRRKRSFQSASRSFSGLPMQISPA